MQLFFCCLRKEKPVKLNCSVFAVRLLDIDQWKMYLIFLSVYIENDMIYDSIMNAVISQSVHRGQLFL